MIWSLLQLPLPPNSINMHDYNKLHDIPWLCWKFSRANYSKLSENFQIHVLIQTSTVCYKIKQSNSLLYIHTWPKGNTCQWSRVSVWWLHLSMVYTAISAWRAASSSTSSLATGGLELLGVGSGIAGAVEGGCTSSSSNSSASSSSSSSSSASSSSYSISQLLVDNQVKGLSRHMTVVLDMTGIKLA